MAGTNGWVESRRGLLDHMRLMGPHNGHVFEALRLMADANTWKSEFTVCDLADTVGMSKSATCASLRWLDEHRYIKYTPTDNKWKPSKAFIPKLRQLTGVKHPVDKVVDKPVDKVVDTSDCQNLTGVESSPVLVPIESETRRSEVSQKTPESPKSKNKEKEKEIPPKPPTAKSVEYSPDFDTLWAMWPSGRGTKMAAYRQYLARIKEGHTHGEMMTGAMRYIAFCRATQSEFPKYVKMAETFFGRDLHFTESWKIPATTIGSRQPTFAAAREDAFAGL